MSSRRQWRFLAALTVVLVLAIADAALPRPLNLQEQTPVAYADCMPSADSVVTLGGYEQQAVAGTQVYFNDNVLPIDRQQVVAGLSAIQGYFTHNMEGLPAAEDRPVCIDIRVTSSALAGSGNTTGTHVIIFTAPEGWPFAQPWHLQLVTAHEYVHAWQYMLADKELDGPTWLIEGAAQFLAVRALIAAGSLTTLEAQREMPRPTGPMVPLLERLEEPEGFNIINSPYDLSYVAVDMLTKQTNVRSLETYWRLLGTGSTWQTAFEQAFRITPSAFYAEFDGGRVRSPTFDIRRGLYERFVPVGAPFP